MHVRIVRFTDIDRDRIAGVIEQVEQADGPPEGVPSSGIQMLVDDEQGTAVVLQFYDSAEDMAEGERVFGAMDPSETPGARASVDRCEVKLDRRA
jgi:hypothetical protein